MRVIVDASEVHQLADDIRRHADETPGKTGQAVSVVGHRMEASAIAKSPDQTGALDRSMRLDFSGLGFDLGPTVSYGELAELGGANGQTPEPYLGPAFDEHLPNLEQALGDIGEQAFDRG